MAGYLFQAGAFVASGAALSGYALYKDIKYAGQKRKFQSIDEGIDVSADLKKAKVFSHGIPTKNARPPPLPTPTLS